MSWISMTLPRVSLPRVSLPRVTLRRVTLRRATLLPVLAGLFLAAPSALWAQPEDIVVRELTSVQLEAQPPLPDPAIFPVQLVADDDSAESELGVGAVTARQFLWFHHFEPQGPLFELREIWVLFPAGQDISAGQPIQLVVYQDADDDPSAGTELLLAFYESIQAADGETFSVYELPEPLVVSGSDSVLIGVVNRFVQSGVSPSSRPAAFDTGASEGRSWLAVWSGDPPDPPVLPPDSSLINLDSLQPGNWMIRGFGVITTPVAIPTLEDLPSAVLALLLAALGWLSLSRRI